MSSSISASENTGDRRHTGGPPTAGEASASSPPESAAAEAQARAVPRIPKQAVGTGPSWKPGRPPRRSRLAVAAALRLEALAAGRSGLPTDAVVVRTGMGPERASRANQAVRAAKPDAVAVVGLGGGLAPGVRPGDVIVASEVRTGDGTVTGRCPSAPLLAGELRRAGLTVHIGPVVSVPRLAVGTARAELAATGAIAVDMESAYLSPSAAGKPFAVVRVIVDTAAEPLGRIDLARRGVSGLRTLRRLGGPLGAWAAAVGQRRVLLAEPRAFCAGVERAIEVVERALELHGAPVYVRKQIVHNTHVVNDLASRGAVFVDELDEVPPGATVVFSAHGVAPAVHVEAAGRNLDVIDATCPLVEKVHAEARRFTARGDTVLLIGHAGHEEVDGTLGEAPGRITLVESAEDVPSLQVEDPERVTYLMQTTLAVDEAEEVVDALKARFPAIVGPGSADICYATSNRQNAVRRVASEADLVLVVGSENSANSRRLAEVARRDGVASHLVESVDEVRLDWLAGADTIGISAGASAPPSLVHELADALAGLGATTVATRSIGTESIAFTLPKEVRRPQGG
ncbi:4-hydroxy-3-methylbut-2-enyl diphosphate reductase [Frankia sp. AgB1.9]|uniref:4-hydroxy-3-methylbut-2-enyl diphosphate reductase n=1 Tax=unclassified Frankia TaxID=2632575 RepID=UPI0019318008|nr:MULTISPECIES: 4-hydroxy-3-methylbut-2-enyl diphosphate reductase [unclassified Frankia]MBL7491378.1 4-hydroxy-3-methylbut-2-enyl diphosphate reductase [Frankia sp. AgW1.1]MBL7547041.1 4-hydroxy-3-methylbut-2-enyl diphosphate reductase [Frankia sp. AgB1.9]MBL7621633.1 4-hydroxy-3-methylbut-2-enyl diphosphate reductase [Frankia sp. AgB1.8]